MHASQGQGSLEYDHDGRTGDLLVQLGIAYRNMSMVVSSSVTTVFMVA